MSILASQSIGFIGAGNMAEALIRGLVKGGHVGAERITASGPRNERLAEAPTSGKPVLQHDKDSRGALAYLALAGEMLRKDDDAAANEA